MAWDVEYTNEFGRWWVTLSDEEQESVASYVELLEVTGPQLPFPYSSAVLSSRHGQMRELFPTPMSCTTGTCNS